MPMETRSSNALFKRAEQLKRWEESETNRVSSDPPKDKKKKIRFSDGCVFLAACASGDKEEVERLLSQGADINTANVDGLTALHQACIDDNYEMVQFLVEHNCDINKGDNEGWTPLHATTSCGILSIARYLIEHGADVAAVNNDGDLPIDIAESEEMEELLQAEIDRQEIDCDAARTEEEHIMLEDAKRWANNQYIEDCIHPKTGATALHVAAAKGYIRVMSILIKAGADVNAQDNDDWTPLHAAAHWGQREACEMLVESLADMTIVNSAGQTCFDVADPELVKVLEELKKKQNSLQKPDIKDIDLRKVPPPLKRRTSVNRMSVADKNNVVIKDTFSERLQIQAKLRLQDMNDDKDRKQPPGIEVELESAEEMKKEESEIAIRNKANNAENEKEIISSVSTNLEKVQKDESLQSKVVAEPELPDITKQTNVRKRDVSRSSGDSDAISAAKVPLLSKDEEETIVLRKVKQDSSDQINLKPQIEEINKNKNRKSEGESQPKVPSDVPCVKFDSLSPESLPSITAQAPSSSSQTRRSFVPPVRDEESETQRKAHAKRVRETRRSTQGVTLEDIKLAEQQLLKKQQEADEKKEQENKEKRGSDAENNSLNTKASAINTALTKSITKAEKRISLDDKEDLKTEQSTTQLLQDLPLYSSNTDKSNVSKYLTQQSDSSDIISTKLRSRSSKTEDAKTEHEIDSEKDGDNRNAQGTQAVIQRRRRPKRRSTGVNQMPQEENQESANTMESKEEKSESSQEEPELKAEKRKEIMSSSSESSECLGWAGNVGSKRDSDRKEIEKDYKKFYHQMKDENKTLKDRLKKVEVELDNTKQQLQKALQNNSRNSLSDAEKRERRSLERKISELEEELKKIAKIKVENEILKTENKSLSQVLFSYAK
ncbi:protein phosphatase 1 regulatory subunit 12A-like isoform X2 [Centruroides vittatus]|uniref:protein phosphatase 1 regulatory subunit 12A-like isoform X2 n=1 Tax=Centruroides vittatus TaxID=120091 RepID=UPI003510A3F1